MLLEETEDPLQDLLATLYLLAAVAHRGGARFFETENRIRGCMDIAEVKESGEAFGSWAPVGDFGDEVGRYGMAGVGGLLRLTCHRQNKLKMLID